MQDDGHGPLTLALSGDSLITRRVAVYEDDATRDLIDLVQGADVSFTNLETVPNNFQGYPVQESGGAHLGAHEWVLDELADFGFNLLGAPNNHSLNYGVVGLLALIDILDKRGVNYAGIGKNLGEARMPAYLETGAGSVALIACASTFAKGQQASEQRPDMAGRPGLNPLRYDTTYTLPQEQFQALKQIATDLGLEQRRLERIQMGFGFPPDDPDTFPFLDSNFQPGNSASIRTKPSDKDLPAISAWVKEAKMRSDIVVVSVHAHEQGETKEDPAEFLPTFAHAVIDAGADVVVGHGPHLLRGMEIYKGKPIFYSLGNFIGQNELTYKLPSDSYETFRIDPQTTPGEVFRTRSQNDTKGFPSDRRYWQAALPVCEWKDGELTKLEIHPITLGLGLAHHRRGRPRLASGDEASEILERFARLSEPFGASFTERDSTLVLRLDETSVS